jgi:hypothetical protein
MICGWVKVRKVEKLGGSCVWMRTCLRYCVNGCDKRLGERLCVRLGDLKGGLTHK